MELSRGFLTRLIGSAIVSTGILSATVIPYSYTTTGTIAGAPSNIVFNPQSTSVNGSTNAAGNALGLALGSFTLSQPGATINYNNTFTLNILFAAPTISGATSFGALLSGHLKNGTGQSEVALVFAPSSNIFNFTSPSTGSFTFTVHDIMNMDHSAGGPATYTLRGDITGGESDASDPLSSVPEPSSIFLLLTVLGGAGLAMRRKVLSTKS
jgi:hypothetical protein